MSWDMDSPLLSCLLCFVLIRTDASTSQLPSHLQLSFTVNFASDTSGFPNEPAAVIALSTIKEWLAKNHQEVDRIIFCVFLEIDFKIYKKKMSDFFPVDENNEEDIDMKEDTEALEPKGLSPPHKKSKAKKPECSKDSSEDENGPEEKQSVEDMEGQSQEADGVNTTPVPSPASDETVEVCKDEDSAKGDNMIKDSEATDHSACDQYHPNGQENESTENEMKIETESQSSCMESEELSSNQEDATTVEHPEVIPLAEDQEEKEGGEAPDEEEDQPALSVTSPTSNTENAASPEVEMNSQADSVNNTTESEQEDCQ